MKAKLETQIKPTTHLAGDAILGGVHTEGVVTNRQRDQWQLGLQVVNLFVLEQTDGVTNHLSFDESTEKASGKKTRCECSHIAEAQTQP